MILKIKLGRTLLILGIILMPELLVLLGLLVLPEIKPVQLVLLGEYCY